MKAQRGLSRRQFLKLGGVTVAAGALVASGATAINEIGDLSIEQVTAPIPGLPSAFEGFTIAQLSDIHLLPYTRPGFIKKTVEAANSLNPDLTVLTGDYVWHDAGAMADLSPIIASLNARHGVYGILGNHDYWLDVKTVIEGFRQARIPLLVNQHIPVSRGDATIVLAGLDDGWAGHADLTAALDDAPAAAPVILLLHEPDLADEPEINARCALQLAGHSHGGQVRVPGRGALVLPYLARKYDMGLYRVGEMWLYTNRGLGEISVPLRINCPPELTLFTLTRA
jgi:predicted MPP superfamily phosphohydrolase